MFKSGYESVHIHYFIRNLILSKTPSFHKPHNFGKMIFEESFTL